MNLFFTHVLCFVLGAGFAVGAFAYFNRKDPDKVDAVEDRVRKL